jgi:hypothetical protein
MDNLIYSSVLLEPHRRIVEAFLDTQFLDSRIARYPYDWSHPGYICIFPRKPNYVDIMLKKYW